MRDLCPTDRGSCPDSVVQFVGGLIKRLNVGLILLSGSQARGNARRDSDYDLFVLADDLPSGYWTRQGLLRQDRPSWIDVVGFTVEEARQSIHRGLILDALLASLQGRAQQHVSRYDLRKTPWGYFKRGIA